MLMRNKSFMLGLGAAMTLATAATAQLEAATTTVAPPLNGEASHVEIFENIYGGTFTGGSGTYTNESITIQRVADDEDQTFSPGTYDAQVKSAFASISQGFGYVTDEGYTNLLDVSGAGFDATGSATDVAVTGDELRWARLGANGLASSRDADNRDGADHLVTYDVLGLDGDAPVRLLFFEDMFGPYSDHDFQDLVVELKQRAIMAPTPNASLAGLALLALAGVGRLITRRRHRTAAFARA